MREPWKSLTITGVFVVIGGSIVVAYNNHSGPFARPSSATSPLAATTVTYKDHCTGPLTRPTTTCTYDDTTAASTFKAGDIMTTIISFNRPINTFDAHLEAHMTDGSSGNFSLHVTDPTVRQIQVSPLAACMYGTHATHITNWYAVVVDGKRVGWYSLTITSPSRDNNASDC